MDQKTILIYVLVVVGTIAAIYPSIPWVLGKLSEWKTRKVDVDEPQPTQMDAVYAINVLLHLADERNDEDCRKHIEAVQCLVFDEHIYEG
jgi:hypothetical protein